MGGAGRIEACYLCTHSWILLGGVSIPLIIWRKTTIWRVEMKKSLKKCRVLVFEKPCVAVQKKNNKKTSMSAKIACVQICELKTLCVIFPPLTYLKTRRATTKRARQGKQRSQALVILSGKQLPYFADYTERLKSFNFSKIDGASFNQARLMYGCRLFSSSTRI